MAVGIYMIKSPSKKVYIGQSIDVFNRLKYYEKLRCKTQVKLYRSIKKHGWDKHIFSMLTECDISDLNNLERYYQDLYHSVGVNGLNCLLTKSNTRSGMVSKETRDKMSASSKGQIVSEYCKEMTRKAHTGKIVSQETRDKQSKARKGVVTWNKGIAATPEHRKKMSKGRKGKYCLGENPAARIIINTENGIFYDSIIEARLSLNIPRGTMADYLSGKHPNKTSLIYA